MTNDEEIIVLIKNAAQEKQFHKISTEELLRIYNRGSALAKHRTHDKNLIEAVNQFKAEIESRTDGEVNVNTFSTTVAIIIACLIFLLIMSAVVGNFNILIGGVVGVTVFGIYNFFKRRIRPTFSWILTALVLFVIFILLAWLMKACGLK